MSKEFTGVKVPFRSWKSRFVKALTHQRRKRCRLVSGMQSEAQDLSGLRAERKGVGDPFRGGGEGEEERKRQVFCVPAMPAARYVSCH